MRELFVSYGHAAPDRALVDWFEDAATKSGWRVWTDSTLVAKEGSALNDEIAAALARVAALAFVSSSMSVSSKYCHAELAKAMALSTPIFVMEIEELDENAAPPAMFPLAGYKSGVARLFNVSERHWPERVAAAAASVGVHLTALGVDPMSFPPDARVIRPLYTSTMMNLRVDLERLSSAQALAPSNGATAISLALIRSRMKDFDGAFRDAEIALRSAPHHPNSYYAAALVACAAQPASKRSKPEADRILEVLEAGRTLRGAGGHLWLLSALVIENFYLKRYLPPPEDRRALLAAAASIPYDSGEAQRVWDVEGGSSIADDKDWRLLAERIGFSIG